MAVTLDAAALGAGASITDLEVATRLLAVTTALHDRYVGTSTVPDALSNEAVIECAGYLREGHPGGVRGLKAGELEATYAPSYLSAWRHSGAAALVSPFKRRRAR